MIKVTNRIKVDIKKREKQLKIVFINIMNAMLEDLKNMERKK
ncbi:hypothetical protein [Sarcina ventriculi]